MLTYRERGGSCGDLGVERAAQGTDTVLHPDCAVVETERRVTHVSNDIAVHLIEVDVRPGRHYVDLSSELHASLSIYLEEIGGRGEYPWQRDQPMPTETFNIWVLPPSPHALPFTNNPTHPPNPLPTHYI